MNYTSDVLDGSNVFTESHDYLNLKLQSPIPFKDKTESSGSVSNELSPTKPKREDTPSDGLEPSVMSLSQELKHEQPATLLSKFDIFKTLLNDVSGKDRLAKVLAYTLNIIKYYLVSTRRFVIDEKFTNFSLDPRVHYKTPVKYLKLLLFLNSTMLEKKISGVAAFLSSFRYTLRFGGTPNRVRGFILKFEQFVKEPTLANLRRVYLNEGALGDFIDLWYGIFDELELSFKLSVLTSPTFKKFASRQAALAWYADILLGLKKNWSKLQDNREKQVQISIQHQVRQRASLLSKKLVEGIGSTPLRQQLMREFNNKSPMTGGALVNELKQLKHEESIITLDLVRLSFDFICDSIDVFELKLHPLVYLVSGAISGTCGLSKVWVMSKKKMEDK